MAPRFRNLNSLFEKALRVIRPFVPQGLQSKGLATRLRRPILRKPEPMSPALRRRLTEQYRGDIIATGELIGGDLSHWLM
ncbi:MAG TPA: hypothetical protein VHY33_11705 [Thermoanaerobaculia bacterium]|nr:hypothetical protein [Thermoanaerobaculia bacterium]